MAALGVGAVTGAGWLLFNRRAGLLAGLTVALFPPLVYYQTTVQPVALATSLTAFAALAGIWTVRRSSVRAACLFGLVIGLSGLVRPTLLLLGPALFLALLVSWRRRAGWGGLRRMVLLTGFAGLFALGAVLPQTVANYQVGMHALINGSSSVTLYVGNNRDADGSMSLRQAFYVAKARQLGWIDALQADLEADPLRMGELVLHKIGLFWSNVELYNNVDYYLYGLKFSPWLRLTSFNGWLGVSLLGILGFAGLAFLLLEGSPGRQEGAWLLIWGLVALTLGTAVYDMAGRLRALAFPLVAIGVGVTLDRGLAAVRARHRDRRLLTTILIGLVVMLVFQAFEYQFPRKRFLRGDLPAEVVTRYDNFNNEIRLVGALPVETDHRQGGYAYVTLYWQAIAPIQQDYYAFVHLVDLHGNKIAGKDLPAGAITYPDVKSSRWPVGAILAESYLIPLPPDAPPVMEVHVGLYEGETMTRLPLILPDGSPSAQDHIRLGAIGVATEAGFPTVDDPLEPVTYRLGDVLRLTGVYTPRQVAPGDSLAVSLQWEADGPVLDDYNVFIHMVNADRAMVTQHDGPALGADWPTSAMVPGQPFAVQHVLDVPADVPPGEYTLLVGLYSYPSLDRLPAYDGQGALLPDGAIDLARVQITTQAGGD